MNKLIFTAFIAICTTLCAAGHSLTDSILKSDIAAMLTRIAEREVGRCPVSVASVSLRRNTVEITTSITMSYYPVREDNLQALYDSVRTLLPKEYSNRKIAIISDNRPLDELIPLCYRTATRERRFTNSSDGRQLVRSESRPYAITQGLSNRHIALWQSHGRYFNQKKNEWCWQRSLLWQTVEDLYTQSYVLPYLVPMLENAGATVLLPRERDFQSIEIIADNDEGIDTCSRYAETNGTHAWSDYGPGFAHKKEVYLSGENPFADGTSRMVKTVRGEMYKSTAQWSAPIPQEGEYAVYVSYRSLPTSSDDARYAVIHAGGTSRFCVNQHIGGGTWIYLGTFRFKDKAVVTLSNISDKAGQTVCADAVKIGGGMGNIARTVCDSLRTENWDYRPCTSGMPRYCEGSRYWLQWAGFDGKVYNPNRDADDYKDDYMSRGAWVNALMGGSKKLPKESGLGIPIDMSLAFHTDAGITDNDNTIGTLGIFFTRFNKGKFTDKVSRYRSRDLTDAVMSQICSDVRRTFDAEWRRRGMWNRSYFEARVPSVPAMLLELLSHQNLADMRYGHDPNFKFTVARAIYKGILRHLSEQYGTDYVVVPLPVEEFAANIIGTDEVALSWSPVCDSLESTANATAYRLYTRIGDNGFDNGIVLQDTTVVVKQEAGKIYSYRVAAINAGGESFPSETLAACIVPNDKAKVLIVNGFNRVAAPASDACGFHNDFDSGCAYMRDVAFIGEQRIFDTLHRRDKNELQALGASYCDREGGVVGGNTFDYPYLYGVSLAKAGCSFASASRKAVEAGTVGLSEYDAVNLILGKQRTTETGKGLSGLRYRCFTRELQHAIADYVDGGGALFVSGAYIGYDLFKGKGSDATERDFARNTLHIDFATERATRSGQATTVLRNAAHPLTAGEYRFCTDYTSECYTVNSTDAFLPAGEGACALMRYSDTGLPAAIGWRGADNGATFVMGFPFETITDAESRDVLMNDIMKFLKTNRQ